MDVTIIVPVLNRMKFLPVTLASLPADCPLILVDNGSSDGSLEYCREFARKRGNAEVYVEETPGAASARNCGLLHVTTDWVYFFDSDDIFSSLPQSWDTSADIICFPTLMQAGKKIRVRDYDAVDTPHTHILNSMLNTLSMIFRTSYLIRIGGWNPDCLIWDDWELGLRALLYQPHVQWITDKAYHKIVLHPNSITGNDMSSRVDKILNTLSIAFADIHDINQVLPPLHHKAFAALFYRCYIVSGEMRGEGDIEASNKVREFIYAKFRTNRNSHLVGQLFEWAKAKKVRGVWRIAMWLVNKM